MDTNSKSIFNIDSTEELQDAKIIGGNPNGILNFNANAHPWATTLYKKMLARTWFPEHINLSKDKVNYTKLTEEEKRCYDLVLAQLIMNDSIQTNQLMDKFNQYITSPVVNACLARQAYEESLHSNAYTVMAEDICNNTNYIYNMYKHSKELYNKNKEVSNLYASLYKEEATNYKEFVKDMLLACLGNIILEDLIFPCGFVIFYSMANKMPGTAENISEINKDEHGHLQLFRNIVNSIINENIEYYKEIKEELNTNIKEIVARIVDIEYKWLIHVTKDILGYSNTIIKALVETRGNNILRYFNVDTIYEKHTNNPLQQLLNRSLKGGDVSSRENFFERNVVSYSKNTIKMVL